MRVRDPRDEEAALLAVRRGIAEVVVPEYGEDWYRRVSRTRLKMSDGNRCILGQLEPDDEGVWRRDSGYGRAISRLVPPPGNRYRWAEQHGFLSGRVPLADGTFVPVGWSVLDRTWRREIAALPANGHREV